LYKLSYSLCKDSCVDFVVATLTPFCTVLLVSSVGFILSVSGCILDPPFIAGSDFCMGFIVGVVGAAGDVLGFGILPVGGVGGLGGCFLLNKFDKAQLICFLFKNAKTAKPIPAIIAPILNTFFYQILY